MNEDTYWRLGKVTMVPSPFNLLMADQSACHPLGFLPNLPIMFSKLRFLTDVAILRMHEMFFSKPTYRLRRPWLRQAKAEQSWDEKDYITFVLGNRLVSSALDGRFLLCNHTTPCFFPWFGQTLLDKSLELWQKPEVQSSVKVVLCHFTEVSLNDVFQMLWPKWMVCQWKHFVHAFKETFLPIWNKHNA